MQAVPLQIISAEECSLAFAQSWVLYLVAHSIYIAIAEPSSPALCGEN